MSSYPKQFPNGSTFAFTILDDTDDSTLENVKPVYELLYELGFRTTKTAWPCECPEGSPLFANADTLARKEYFDFVYELSQKGIEIACHGATMESSKRDRTTRGLSIMNTSFHSEPRLYCNHGHNKENVYWGAERYRSPALVPLRMLYRLMGKKRFLGQDKSSEYFWGDLARLHFQYVRNFAFNKLNLATFHACAPYGLASTRYVNKWFITSDAPDINAFNSLVNLESVRRLAERGGHSIVSTHLGKGFCINGRLNPQFVETMRYLSGLNGWFVPTSELLDFLGHEMPERARIGPLALTLLELRHILDRVAVKWNTKPYDPAQQA